MSEKDTFDNNWISRLLPLEAASEVVPKNEYCETIYRPTANLFIYSYNYLPYFLV